jgi:hypothetical protein
MSRREEGNLSEQIDLGQISTATSAALQQIQPNVGAPPHLDEMGHMFASEPWAEGPLLCRLAHDGVLLHWAVKMHKA